MKDYESDKILMTFEFWKKSGNSYEKIKEMDLNKGYKQFNFHMDKDTDYYVYLGGVDLSLIHIYSEKGFKCVGFWCATEKRETNHCWN